jgi:hypothetical protein
MRERNVTRKSSLIITLCAVALISLAGSARAQIDPLRLITEMSAVGVSRGQIARLNVYYHDLFPPGPCAQDTVCTPPASFDATLTLYFADGSVCVQRKVTLSQDKGASLGFSPTTFGADGRVALRGEVVVSPDASGYQPRVIPSLEVFDSASGLTGVLNPGSIVGFNPQPEPPGDFNFGLFNVVKGQTARVNVSYVDTPQGFPPGPCRATISFYDGDGRLLGQSAQVLSPGQTVQFDYQTGGLPAGSRVRIRASVHIDAGDSSVMPVVAPSLELFAADTGKSALFIPGKMMGGQ